MWEIGHQYRWRELEYSRNVYVQNGVIFAVVSILEQRSSE